MPEKTIELAECFFQSLFQWIVLNKVRFSNKSFVFKYISIIIAQHILLID